MLDLFVQAHLKVQMLVATPTMILLNRNLSINEANSRLSNMNETQCIIPTGQSGLSNSPHYRDQAEMFHGGLYRTTRFNEEYIRSSSEFKHLILNPEL